MIIFVTTKNLFVSTQSVAVFRMSLTSNIGYLHEEHLLVGLCIGEAVCLGGTGS